MEMSCSNCANKSNKWCVCNGLSDWKPESFKPSEMDLLALESLRDGSKVYSEGGEEVIISSIGDFYRVKKESFLYGEYAMDKIYAEKPCTDLTKEEVKEYLFEKVWMWDNRLNLKQREIVGHKINTPYPYETIHNHFLHASLTKPKFRK